MNLSRRDMLKLSVGAAAMLAAGIPVIGAPASLARKIPIGVQLYSVRQACEKDLPGALAALAKMGFQGVEFAGYYGRNATELRKLLDDNGLKCCGTHTGLNTLLGDELKKTIEFHKILGNKFLICPSLPKEREATAPACTDTGKLFADIAQKITGDGMCVGYHAHGGDFKKFDDGQTPWELIFTAASPEVVMQLDVGNCMDGGGDPYAMLKKFPGRAATIHIKEHGGKPGAAIGEGEVRWPEIFDLCEKPGKTEWYIVEEESKPGAFDRVQACIENLRKMGK